MANSITSASQNPYVTQPLAVQRALDRGESSPQPDTTAATDTVHLSAVAQALSGHG